MQHAPRCCLSGYSVASSLHITETCCALQSYLPDALCEEAAAAQRMRLAAENSRLKHEVFFHMLHSQNTSLVDTQPCNHRQLKNTEAVNAKISTVKSNHCKMKQKFEKKLQEANDVVETVIGECLAVRGSHVLFRQAWKKVFRFGKNFTHRERKLKIWLD